MDNNTNKLNQYQRGYADGYRRNNKLEQTKREKESQRFWNITYAIIIFLLFLIGILYTYNKDAGKNSHYEGDCLIDIATTYTSSHCLDN